MEEREGKRGKEQEQRSVQQVSEDRWGDKEQRTYIAIHIRKTSLKTDRETERGEPTLGSLGREKGKEEKSKSRDLCNRSLKADGETES